MDPQYGWRREMRPLSPELTLLCGWLAQVAGLPGRTRPIPSSSDAVDETRFRQLMEENQLVPLWMSAGGISDESLPSGLQTPPLEWRQAYYQSGRQAALRLTVLRQVGLALQGTVEGVVLKGMALTPTLYREAAARPMRDIDLLFASTADKERARDQLIDAGFSMGASDVIHHHLPPVFDPAGRVSIELHDNLLTPSLPTACMEALWSSRQSIAEFPGLSLLSPAAAWFHHALHAVSDPVDSPLLRDLFEVAWLASRLTETERKQVLELASLSGRQSTVLGSGNLAADLFGGLRWSDAVSGSYETWCRRRLEWTRPVTLVQRFVQHAGRERFNRLCEAPDERNPLPWLMLVAKGIAQRLFRGIGGRCRRWPSRYVRPAYPFLMVDGNALIRNTDTRAVHMLNQQAAAVWNAAEVPLSQSEFVRQVDAGFTDRECRQVIRTLVQSGLLESVSFKRSRKSAPAS